MRCAPRRRPGRRATRAPARPATFRWIRAFGSRSATEPGRSSARSRSDTVRLRGPSVPTAIQAARLPSSSQVASTRSPSGARRRTTSPHAAATSCSPYCRSTFAARTSAGRLAPSGPSSNPPWAKRTPARASGWAARTRSGSISRPTTSTSGRTRSEPVGQLDRRHGGGAVAEVDDQRVGGRPQRRRSRSGEPAVHAAQPVRVRGAARHGAHGARRRRHGPIIADRPPPTPPEAGASGMG